ncbi:MAG: hypothetical protein R3A12_04045 [Ignavibacteria bacterium]
MTLQRLLFEYKLSVRYAKTKNDIVTDEILSQSLDTTESICGKLIHFSFLTTWAIITGEILKHFELRLTAQLDYRHLET